MDGGSRISRRTFLLGSVAAGALAACTAEGPGAPLTSSGAGAPTSSTARPSSSARPTVRPSTLGVAVIGCGGHGRKLAARLAHDSRVRLGVVCDPDSDRAAALAAALAKAGHPRPDEVTDLRRVLDDPSIDAVTIATPHHWHALAAVWALQAGTHVYLEKPATHSLGEGSALLDAWRASGLVVEVGTQRRSHPGLQEAIADLHDGRIGAVDHARCYSWKRRPPIGPEVRGSWPASLDPDLWFGPRPVQRPSRERFHYDWHWFGEYGNGGLGNNGVHRLDVARWGMRLPAAGDRVLSLAGRLGPQDAGRTPNTALTVVAFGGRSVLHDLRGRPTRPDADLDQGMSSSDEVVFVGDGAAIIVSRTGGRLVDGDGRVVHRYGRDAQDVDPITRHLAGFVAACLAGDPDAVAVGPAEGVASAEMCHAPAAAHVAAEATGRRVDPDRVRADVRAVCGPVADDATNSVLAHVASQADAQSMAYSGTRTVSAGVVEGAPESFEYRPGFEVAP